MLKQKTPLKPGSKGLARTAPMKRGTVALVAKKPIARGESQLARNTKPMRARSRTNSNPRKGQGEDKLCRGQPCYLLVPGIESHPIDTVVPCHSNSLSRGKGMGIKADDKYTVPGCFHCHYTLDQGRDLDKEQRRAIWESAYQRWAKYRMENYGV